jgi:hypothetical protein
LRRISPSATRLGYSVNWSYETKLDHNVTSVNFINHLDNFLTKKFSNLHLSRIRLTLKKTTKKRLFGARMLNNYVFLNRPLALQTHIVKNKRAILIKQVVLLYNVLKQYFKFKNCSPFFLKSLSFRSRIEKHILHQFLKKHKNPSIVSKFRYLHKKRKKKKRGWHVKKLHSRYVLHNIKFLSCL